MKRLPLFIYSAICGISCGQAMAAEQKEDERPNILWLTFEDTSASEFGCYGNPDVHTPHADSLASIGIQFMNAWSVAPQSSPARSSLITGCYATTFGMDVHPVPFDTPADIFSHKDCARPDIIAPITAKHITTLPQTIKAVGMNAITRHPTIAPNEKRDNHSLPSSIQ